jgi:hypothetical protein
MFSAGTAMTGLTTQHPSAQERTPLFSSKLVYQDAMFHSYLVVSYHEPCLPHNSSLLLSQWDAPAESEPSEVLVLNGEVQLGTQLEELRGAEWGVGWGEGAGRSEMRTVGQSQKGIHLIKFTFAGAVLGLNSGPCTC